ncbi:MAG: hypothetical protein JW939_01970 [Candidatus Thermoplasmatota archaeon]|nr:hypothetical protein [Candidatus Thermoplasmatota archaeon]
MDRPGLTGSKGTRRSERQARLGAIFIWSSICALILSLAVLFSFVIVYSGGELTEDDFKSSGFGTWSSEVHVGGLGTITGSVRSHDLNFGNFRIKVTIYDPSGEVEEEYEQRTPVIISVQVFDPGTYRIEIEIMDHERSIEDLDISISSTDMDILLICCGVTGAGFIFLALFVTGFILLMVSIFTRRGEMRPPRPRTMYGYPPPYHYPRYEWDPRFSPRPQPNTEAYHEDTEVIRGRVYKGSLYDRNEGPPRSHQRPKDENEGVGPW